MVAALQAYLIKNKKKEKNNLFEKGAGFVLMTEAQNEHTYGFYKKTLRKKLKPEAN